MNKMILGLLTASILSVFTSINIFAVPEYSHHFISSVSISGGQTVSSNGGSYTGYATVSEKEVNVLYYSAVCKDPGYTKCQAQRDQIGTGLPSGPIDAGYLNDMIDVANDRVLEFYAIPGNSGGATTGSESHNFVSSDNILYYRTVSWNAISSDTYTVTVSILEDVE